MTGVSLPEVVAIQLKKEQDVTICLIHSTAAKAALVRKSRCKAASLSIIGYNDRRTVHGCLSLKRHVWHTMEMCCLRSECAVKNQKFRMILWLVLWSILQLSTDEATAVNVEFCCLVVIGMHSLESTFNLLLLYCIHSHSSAVLYANF